ncbi:MAG: glycosyltransferase family 92 protein [Clostridiales bacterium]|nr:glycosyltransferase family 92 protein [Clostridiales bacterium]
MVAIVKNEAPYIKEWIEFHKLVGVTRFYIYDNDSEDDLKSVLQPYIENGEVICKYYSGTSMQLSAYNDAIRNYKSNSKYMAFIDLDEFLVPCVHGKLLSETIDDILNSEIHAGGIGVTWRVFGSSGYVKKPEGLVTENYLKRAVDNCWQNWHIKTVCNPRLIKEYVSPHFPIYKLGNWNINENGRRLRGWFSLGQCYEKIKLNHYFCKSREEALSKWNRGLAESDVKYDWMKFDQHDLNDVYDDGMLEYASEIKMVLSGKR